MIYVFYLNARSGGGRHVPPERRINNPYGFNPNGFYHKSVRFASALRGHFHVSAPLLTVKLCSFTASIMSK